MFLLKSASVLVLSREVQGKRVPLINLKGLNPLGLEIGDRTNSSIKRVGIKGRTGWKNAWNDKILAYPPLILNSNNLWSGRDITTLLLHAL